MSSVPFECCTMCTVSQFHLKKKLKGCRKPLEEAESCGHLWDLQSRACSQEVLGQEPPTHYPVGVPEDIVYSLVEIGCVLCIWGTPGWQTHQHC